MKSVESVSLDLNKVLAGKGYKVGELLHYLVHDKDEIYYHLAQTDKDEVGIISIVPSRGGAELVLSILKQTGGTEVLMPKPAVKLPKKARKELIM